MSGCTMCPIMCGADRRSGDIGVCGVSTTSYVARAARHYYEEPPISGTCGSGAVFFVGCNMACVFCQNITISRTVAPNSTIAVDEVRLADIMLRLQELGAHNINLVTPTPHVGVLIGAITIARRRGLFIPIVYNTNGYELVETVKLLDGLIDVYLPDFKYATQRMGQRCSGRPDYCEYIVPAIHEMIRQVDNSLVCDEHGVAVRGLVIRHLVLPAAVDETRRVLDVIKGEFSTDTCLSIMSQYTPINGMEKPFDRRLTKAEYSRALDYAVELGFTNVFTQGLTSADSTFTPEFNGFIE